MRSAFRDVIGCAMFLERTNCTQRERRIPNAKDEKRGTDAAAALKPCREQCEKDEMQGPGACNTAIAPCDLRERRDDRFHNGKPGAEHNAPEERVPDNQQEPHEPARAAPALGGDKIAFRVQIRVGEMRVVMVAQMRFAINRVREPDRERGGAKQCVEHREACRMAVQEFMLQ